MTVPSLFELSELHAHLCSALADATRIRLLYALHEGPCHVSALAERLDAPQSTVSRHLKVLRERGLVRAERQGQMVIYHLADERVIEALEIMRRLMADLTEHRAQVIQRASDQLA